MSAPANRSTSASAKSTCWGRFIESSGPCSSSCTRRGVDLRIRVAEQERAEGHHEVDVLVAVDVGDPAAAAALDVHRRALGRGEHPPGQVVGAGDDALGAREPVAGRRVAFLESSIELDESSMRFRQRLRCAASARRDEHGGDPVRAGVGRLEQLLAEDVGIDLAVVPREACGLQARGHQRAEAIDAVADRAAGVEQQRAAGREPRRRPARRSPARAPRRGRRRRAGRRARRGRGGTAGSRR